MDDNEQVGRSTVQGLSELGFETVWVGDAGRAIAALDASAGRIDVVFSDVVMPGMSGIHLGRHIRQRFFGLAVVLPNCYGHALAEQGSDGFPGAAEALCVRRARADAGRPAGAETAERLKVSFAAGQATFPLAAP